MPKLKPYAKDVIHRLKQAFDDGGKFNDPDVDAELRQLVAEYLSDK